MIIYAESQFLIDKNHPIPFGHFGYKNGMSGSYIIIFAIYSV